MSVDFSGNGMWLVLMVKDKFARDCERKRIKGQLIDLLGLQENEIFYVPFELNNPYSYYVFVKEKSAGDLQKIFGSSTSECFTGYRNCKSKITNSEIRQIVKNNKVAPNNDIKFGDFVKIKSGTYSNLYGIVLRQSPRKDKVYVGMKFCFGIVIEEYHTGELEAIDNLFNHIKVLS